jgi:hypothetical protein
MKVLYLPFYGSSIGINLSATLVPKNTADFLLTSAGLI